jgi:hypothetical protein
MASKFLLSTLATGAAASKILILGDSMGEFTCGSENSPGTNHFKETCKGSTVINKAAAGTTAYQWRAGGDQEASEAFAAAGSGVTHVWLSVGGNDFQSPAEGKSTPSSSSSAPSSFPTSSPPSPVSMCCSPLSLHFSSSAVVLFRQVGVVQEVIPLLAKCPRQICPPECKVQSMASTPQPQPMPWVPSK